VGRGPTAVIDPGVDDVAYLDKLVELDGDITYILITHRHADHVGGVAELQRRTGAIVRAYGDAPAGGCEVQPVADGDLIEVGSARLMALHLPGHASDHLGFSLEGTASLFAGDNVLGEGTAVIAPPDGDMADYMHTLERLAQMHIDRIYTGHFKPLDGGTAVIRGYIEHRRAREQAVLDAVRSADRAVTPEEVVEIVYTDVPTALHPIARFSVEAHLLMLSNGGYVRKAGSGRWEATGR